MAILALALVPGCEGDGSDRDGSQVPTVQPQQFTPVIAETLGVETAPVKGTDGRFHVVYELRITNAKPVPATLQRIEVLDGADSDRVLATIEGERLLENLRTLAITPVESAVIEPDGSRLLFIDVVFDELDEAPESLIHRFDLLGAENPGATEPTRLSYTITPFTIGDKEPVTIGPPLAGDGWVAVNGCCSPGFAHRDAVQSVNGSLYDSQRFAIDYMRLGADGRVVTGEVSDPDNWEQYGAEVLAVEDGTVVSTINDLPDQVPGALPDPGSFDSLESVDGNSLVVDFGGGVFGFYAHLQKGSVMVEAGDEIERGQTLALLGNSGNTSAPHLHFHLMTGPEVLAADGIPYVIDSFEYDGRVPEVDFIESAELTEDFGKGRLPSPEPREDELPLNLSIVNFPGE